MSRRGLWQQIYERFDPDRPAGVPAWRADRPLSPAEAIAESLDLPFGDPRVLLMGTVGTGKTTWLASAGPSRSRRAGSSPKPLEFRSSWIACPHRDVRSGSMVRPTARGEERGENAQGGGEAGRREKISDL